jgi:restriction system protein
VNPADIVGQVLAAYHRVHDVTLSTPDGTTQIDHVFFSRYSLFVLETKNMQGWIFGAEKQSEWTQSIFRKKVRFQNPLRQNYKHVKALEAALQVPSETIHSVVSFIGSSTFKTDLPPNVTQGAGLISYIKSFREPVFTEQQVAALLQSLQSQRPAPGFATQRAHIANLRKRAEPTAIKLCPKCGNTLVVRKTQSGPNAGKEFWGCSGYPKCRILREIT